MTENTEAPSEPCGYLVVLRFTSAELPQRLFTSRANAMEFARTVDVAECVDVFGFGLGTHDIFDDFPLSVVEIKDGRVCSAEHVERDLPALNSSIAVI